MANQRGSQEEGDEVRIEKFNDLTLATDQIEVDDAQIMVRLDNGTVFQVVEMEGRLEITTLSGRLSIEPSYANSVTVGAVAHKQQNTPSA
jgi:hypothetical protein